MIRQRRPARFLRPALGAWQAVLRRYAQGRAVDRAAGVPSRRIVALRRLPRGTWQLRQAGAWCTLSTPHFVRGAGWLHMRAARHPYTDESRGSGLNSGAMGKAVTLTVWQCQVHPDAWRRLNVAARAPAARPDDSGDVMQDVSR